MKVLTKVIARDKKFYIIKKDGHYCAIDTALLDENNCLTVGLNGLQMHADKEIDKCIQRAIDAAEIDYLTQNGYTKAQAFCKVMKTPYSEEMEKLFN